MVSCALRSCRSRDGVDKKLSGVTFHRFPKESPRRNAWIKFVNRGAWEPSTRSALCSKHFSESAMDRTSKCYVRLKNDAVPTLQPIQVLHIRSQEQFTMENITDQVITKQEDQKISEITNLDSKHTSLISINNLSPIVKEENNFNLVIKQETSSDSENPVLENFTEQDVMKKIKCEPDISDYSLPILPSNYEAEIMRNSDEISPGVNQVTSLNNEEDHYKSLNFGTNTKVFTCHDLRKTTPDIDNTKMYSCDQCPFTTTTSFHMKKHTETEHGNIKLLQCNFCNYQSKNKRGLRRHFISKHDENAEIYSCNYCTYTTKYKLDLKRHYGLTHNESETSYACEHCTYETKRKYSLVRHIRMKHKEDTEDMKCPFCEYRTRYRENMKKHLKTHDDLSDSNEHTEGDSSAEITTPNDDIYYDKPDFVPVREDLLYKKLESKDSEDKIKQEAVTDDEDNCEILEDSPVDIEEHKTSLAFETKEPLNNRLQNLVDNVIESGTSKNIEKHNSNLSSNNKNVQDSQNCTNIQFVAIGDDTTKNYQCKFCSFRTGSKPYLSAHVKTEHEEIMSYMPCQYCTYKAKTITELNRHFKLKHDQNTEVYKCAFCPFETKYKPEFNRHYKLKHDENSLSFACVYCKYVTKRKPSLTRHIRIRHNEETEKLKCPHCVYETKWKQSLNNHVKRVHRDSDNVFQCTHCEYKSIFKHSYVLHMKKAHEMN